MGGGTVDGPPCFQVLHSLHHLVLGLSQGLVGVGSALLVGFHGGFCGGIPPHHHPGGLMVGGRVVSGLLGTFSHVYCPHHHLVR